MKNLQQIIFAIILTAATLFSGSCISQNSKDSILPPLENSFRLNIVNPSAEWHFVRNENALYVLKVGLNYYGEIILGYPSSIEWQFKPMASISHRWYYNRLKRLNNGRIVKKNSGNYVSLKFMALGPDIISTDSKNSDFIASLGPQWGMQRKYGKSLSFKLEIGPVVYWNSDNKVGVELSGGIGLGFIIK
ncbi:MAG: hypothetical protein EA362_07165 [Saprospirales bacterium]|nr:MAG: hypothetical protein EA362_07165 [Saprospirales bacterium]